MSSPADAVSVGGGRVPPCVDRIDAAWLTGILRAGGALRTSRSVSKFTLHPLSSGAGIVADLYRVRFDSDGGDHGTVVLKSAVAGDHPFASRLGLFAREVAFYRDLADQAPLSTPRAYLADASADGQHFLLVLEDLGHLRHGDQLAGLSLDHARAAIRAVARFHAWSWRHERLRSLGPDVISAGSPGAIDAYATAFDEGWRTYCALAERPPHPAVERFATRFKERLPALLDAMAEPTTLAHGDFRSDNLFFGGAADDSVTVVDFQFAGRMCGIADVAYLVSQSLTPGVRRGQEPALVKEYVASLRRFGVDDYDLDQAWHQYRVATAFSLVYPVMAMRAWVRLGARARRLTLTLVDRAAAAIVDVDALTPVPT